MSIDKLIAHIEILALTMEDRKDFNELYLFHAELIDMKLRGVKYYGWKNNR